MMVLTVFLPDRISPGNLRRGVSVRCWSNLILMGKEVLVSLFVRFFVFASLRIIASTVFLLCIKASLESGIIVWPHYYGHNY